MRREYVARKSDRSLIQAMFPKLLTDSELQKETEICRHKDLTIEKLKLQKENRRSVI